MVVGMMRVEEARIRFMLDDAQETLRELHSMLTALIAHDELEPSDHLQLMIERALIVGEADPDDPHYETPHFTECVSCERLVIPIIDDSAPERCEKCERDGDETLHATWQANAAYFDRLEANAAYFDAMREQYDNDPSPYDGTYSEE